MHDERLRPLTEKGRRDAKMIAEALQGIRFGYMYSSPYIRAVETIMPLAEELGIGIEIVDDFRERRIAAEWIEDYDGFMKRQWADFTYKLPGGESLIEVQQRSTTVIGAICRKISGKTAAIATHGMALSVILNYYDPDFDYQSCLDILHLAPFVVCIEFKGEGFLRWEHVAPVQKTEAYSI